MKVSFDFDETLDREDVQEYATKLISEVFDVYVVTARVDDVKADEKGWWWIKQNNLDLYKVTDKLGIKRENIIFMEYADKYVYLENKDFIFHLDDSELELRMINENKLKCVPIYMYDINWKEKCDKAINEFK